MKTAIYVAEGVRQIVFTYENDYEKKVLNEFKEGSQTIRVYFGNFFECRGGWVRHTVNYHGQSMFGYSEPADNNNSLIMVLRDEPEETK